jgi:drug/metabolite transporter (DMT)-like permease
MTVVIAGLVTAVLFGAGDFCGGLATKRATVLQVVAGAHGIGLVGIVAVCLLAGTQPRPLDLALGATGGVLGGVGVALLYRRLAAGPMQVVAPLAGVTSAAVPALWGQLIGERLSPLAWSGVLLALLAIGLVSCAQPVRGRVAPVTARVVVESLLAGGGFGGFFIFLDATDPASAPWPIAGARLLTTAGLVAIVVARREPLIPSVPSATALIASAGVLDVAAIVGFLYATTHGPLTVASVLSSLYPVATAALARVVLAERVAPAQLLGFAAALLATGLIAAG